MAASRLLLLTAAVLVVLCYESSAEIHRAKPLNTRPYHPGRNRHQHDVSSNTSHWIVDAARDAVWSFVAHERAQVWTYSILCSMLVGLSGIFPLLVIPLEAGEELRKGAAASGRLKLLLSFAVGGLLGDVFLHLLPEAWAHLHKLGGPHDGNIEIGIWVLTGLLSFMIIEKLFPEMSDDDVTDSVQSSSISIQSLKYPLHNKEVHDHARNGTRTLNECCVSGDLYERLQDGLTKSLDSYRGIAEMTHNGLSSLGGSVQNGYANAKSSKKPAPNTNHLDDGTSDCTTYKHETHIKTSGWLNLMANMIDNFTHGLAVAGSFSVGTKTGFITTFAILLHEVPHEIGDFAILLRAGFDRWKAAKAQLLTATGGMLGAIAALCAESTEKAGDRTAWILPFTSGGFIYIAMVTVLPDLLRDDSSAWASVKQILLLCSGIAVMAAITIYVD